MSIAWHKILAAIDTCDRVIHARDSTIDVEIISIETRHEDLMRLRSNWRGIWKEAKEVALPLMMKIEFCHGRRHVDRKSQRMHDDTSTTEANMAEMIDTDDSPEEAYFI